MYSIVLIPYDKAVKDDVWMMDRKDNCIPVLRMLMGGISSVPGVV